jgi:hypothetical protein
MMTFEEFLALPKKILVEAPIGLVPPVSQVLDEATRATVGKFTARRDPPHFQGDEYHAHVEIPGGFEVAWGKSGSRRHPNKFPADVPKDAKAAIAKILGVDTDLLEVHKVHDAVIHEDVLLIEVAGVAQAGR